MKLPWIKPAMLGIDIQPDAIRLAQLQRKRRGYDLQRVEVLPLSEALIEEGKIKHWDRLTETLYQAVQDLALRSMPAVVAVPVSMVRIKELTLPKQLADDALEIEINAHIQRELLGMSGQLCMDYHSTPIPQSAMQTVHCVAIREDYLSRLVTAINSAGINLKVVDVDVYALQRFNHHQSGLMPSLWDLNFMVACGLAMREAPPW